MLLCVSDLHVAEELGNKWWDQGSLLLMNDTWKGICKSKMTYLLKIQKNPEEFT